MFNIFPLLCLIIFIPKYFITSCSIQSQRKTQSSATWATSPPERTEMDSRTAILVSLMYLDMLGTFLQSSPKISMRKPTERSLRTATRAITTEESNFPMMSNTPQQQKRPMCTPTSLKNRKVRKAKSAVSKPLPSPTQPSTFLVTQMDDRSQQQK